MADVLFNPYPARFVDPNEPGLVAAYTFADNELAQFGRYINRAALGGAALDLTTRSGAPIIGPSGGMMAVDHGSWWQGTTVNVGALNFAYAMEIDFQTTPGANQVIYQNGGGTHALYNNLGTLQASLTGGASVSQTPYNVVGRGPALYHVLYDGTNCYLLANGTVVDSDAMVALNTNAGLQYMRGPGDHRAHRVYNYRMTVAEARASYIRDFASKVLWQWTPRDVGAGPAGGILTGSYSGVGGWTCPLGAATMSFVWVNDLSLPGGGYLALTDTGALSMARIDLDLGRLPTFGSWLVRYKLRNPVFGGDNPRIGLIPMRGVDMTGAAAGSYWVEAFNTGGGWWRTQTYRNNVLIGVDADHAVTAADDDCAFLVTHAVDGNWRIYSYSRMLGTWAWRAAAVVNDVTNMNYQTLSIAPRGSLIKSVECLQGEQTHAELSRVVS